MPWHSQAVKAVPFVICTSSHLSSSLDQTAKIWITEKCIDNQQHEVSVCNVCLCDIPQYFFWTSGSCRIHQLLYIQGRVRLFTLPVQGDVVEQTIKKNYTTMWASDKHTWRQSTLKLKTIQNTKPRCLSRNFQFLHKICAFCADSYFYVCTVAMEWNCEEARNKNRATYRYHLSTAVLLCYYLANVRYRLWFNCGPS